ncbi:MAG: hypothetical protein ACKOYC_05310 [Bacteroidota bacterium]
MQRFSFVVCLMLLSALTLRGQTYLSHTLFPGSSVAVFSNPALLIGDTSNTSKMEFNTNYKSKLQLKELSVSDVSFGLQISQSDKLAIGMIYEGYELFNTTRAMMGYAKQLGENVILGVQMEWRRIQQGDIYGGANAFMGGMGVQLKLTNQLSASMALSNPNRSNLGGNRSPMMGGIILHWRVSKQCTWLASMQQNGSDGVFYTTQLQYQSSKRFHIKVGASSGFEPIQFAFGFHLGHMQLTARSSYHELLGFSPGVGICFMK